jgi:hypothetical protein
LVAFVSFVVKLLGSQKRYERLNMR